MDNSKIDIKDKKNRKELLQKLKEKRNKYFGTNGQIPNRYLIMSHEETVNSLINSPDHPLHQGGVNFKGLVHFDSFKPEFMNRFCDYTTLDRPFRTQTLTNAIDEKYIGYIKQVMNKYNIDDNLYQIIKNNGSGGILFDVKIGVDLQRKIVDEIKSLNGTKIKFQSIKA